jgi:Spy/CpxP family protein refolding chaperone
MKTVRIVASVAVALVLTASLLAQEPGKDKAKTGKPPRLGQALLTMERMRAALDQLDLSDEQKEKLKEIREKAGPRMKEVWEKTRGILSEDQTRTAGEALKEARDAGKKGPAVIASLLSALKLDGEQKEKLLKLEQESLAIQRELVKEIMGVLSPEQREKFRAAMRPERTKGDKPAEKPDAK